VVFVFQGQFNGEDFLLGAMGQVGEGMVFNLAVGIAIGVAQEDAGIDFAFDGILRSVDMHSGHNIMGYIQLYKHIIAI